MNYAAWPIHILIGGLLVSAGTDLMYQRIPNVITFTVWAAGTFYQYLNYGYRGLLDGELAVLLIFLAGIVIFLLGLFGAGDIKLLMAVSVYFGLGHLISLLFSIFLFGSVFGAIRSFRNQSNFLRTQIEFAVPVMAGTLLNLLFFTK